MLIKCVNPGYDFLANCYILTDEKTGYSAIVDPGLFTDNIRNTLRKDNINLKYIILTHGHFDHVLGAYDIKQETGAEIVIHKNDNSCLSDLNDNLLGDRDFESFRSSLGKYFTPCEADILLNDGDIINIGDSSLKVMHTPGHSAGCVCYIDEESRSIISGDTLFYKTVGRADKGSADPDALEKSVMKLVSLEGNYKIYPGHGALTELEHERNENFFIRHYRKRQNNDTADNR